MFSFGKAVILTGMDSCSPISPSAGCKQMRKAQETPQLEVLHPLCSSSQKFSLGHRHTLLRTQTGPRPTSTHLCGSSPVTSLALHLLFLTEFHRTKFPFGFAFHMTAQLSTSQ